VQIEVFWSSALGARLRFIFRWSCVRRIGESHLGHMLEVLQNNFSGPLIWTPPHLQIPFSHKPFGTRAGFEFIFPRGRTAIYPFPFTRAEASLIGIEFACPWLKTLLFSFTNQHGHFTHVYLQQGSAHKIAPTSKSACFLFHVRRQKQCRSKLV
jgi:hypothetical protein